MNAPLSELSPSTVWMSKLGGMLLFLGVMIGSMLVVPVLQERVMQPFSLHGGSPGDAPHWHYFITRDFAKGIGSAAVLLLCVLAAAATWRWWPDYAGMMVWMPLIFLGGDAWRSWIIHQAWPGLLEGGRMATRWPNFESYLHDHEIAQAEMLVRVTGLALAGLLSVMNYHVQRRRALETARAQKDEG